jgi:hypothetical protein
MRNMASSIRTAYKSKIMSSQVYYTVKVHVAELSRRRQVGHMPALIDVIV